MPNVYYVFIVTGRRRKGDWAGRDVAPRSKSNKNLANPTGRSRENVVYQKAPHSAEMSRPLNHILLIYLIWKSMAPVLGSQSKSWRDFLQRNSKCFTERGFGQSISVCHKLQPIGAEGRHNRGTGDTQQNQAITLVNGTWKILGTTKGKTRQVLGTFWELRP